MKIKLALIVAAVFAILISSSGAHAHPATGIVVDRNSNVYFSDLETIWKVDTNGKLSVFRAAEGGRHVHELFMDQQDNIYGGDISYNPSTKTWPSAVWKMTPQGQFTWLLEPTEHPPRGISIWRDRDGNNYWIDQNNHTKTQTLLLRRTPDGTVTTFAGGAYGHADGKGTASRFGSVWGMFFAADDTIYLTDGPSVRKVSRDGTVSTVARGLDFRTRDDDPTLPTAYGSLAGLCVDPEGNIFVADAGRRRLLKVDTRGEVSVILRVEAPFFPTGVASDGRNLYVLEVGFTMPNISSGPRVRKITPDGKSTILVVVGGDQQSLRTSLATNAGVAVERGIVSLSDRGRVKYVIASVSLAVIAMVAFVWWRGRRQRA
jgi:sugar lactone lactonase YvrE